MSASAVTSHPSGTGPMSESTGRVGRASKAGWGMEAKAVAPAALAFNGLKSTNHAEAGVQDARRERQAGLALRHQCGTGTGATSQSTEVAGPRAPGGRVPQVKEEDGHGPSGGRRRMGPRFTTSATAPSRPRCTDWCSSTP